MDDRLILKCSGRQIDANHGFIGINSDIELSEGYDGFIQTDVEEEYLPPPWTKEEKKELSEYMISLWKKFGEIE